MGSAEQPRTAWTDLPDGLRRSVESVLGGPVTRAVSQPRGFSPGSADRVETAHGTRAFVKAVERGRNPGTFDLHHREIAVMAAMPSGVSAPALLDSYVAGDWVGLILADIEGRHPGEALDGADVVPVLDALATFPEVRESGFPGLPDAADEIAGEAVGWSELEADGGVGDLPDWVRDTFDRLRAASDGAASASGGQFLLHLDCRADNVLIDRAGAAWIVDWPWAAVGARWVDGLTYLLDARLRGETIDTEEVLRHHDLFAGVAAESIDAVLAALTGGFFNKARHPAPQNLPTLRDFQRREAIAGAAWLRERWS